MCLVCNFLTINSKFFYCILGTLLFFFILKTYVHSSPCSYQSDLLLITMPSNLYVSVFFNNVLCMSSSEFSNFKFWERPFSWPLKRDSFYVQKLQIGFQFWSLVKELFSKSFTSNCFSFSLERENITRKWTVEIGISISVLVTTS